MKKTRIFAGITALLISMQMSLSLSAFAEEETTESEGTVQTDILAGDVNLDNKVNILDVIALNRAILGKDLLTDIQNLAADINQDKLVDATDSLTILKQIVGIVETEEKILYQSAVNLSESVKAETVSAKALDDDFIIAQTGFYLELFQKTAAQEQKTNLLISPYSVMQALAMTANGADGQTRTEMEQTFGGIALDDLNQYLYTQRTNQPDLADCKLLTANSIWYRDAENFYVSPEFLKTNADYYAADVFKAPFDISTARDINTWVNHHTDGMIPQLVKEAPMSDAALMFLINAVTFDAKWASPYLTNFDVHEKAFTAWDGTVQTADMMYSTEWQYLEEEHAAGFMKPYWGGRYAFAALLPEEGLSLDDYISGMTAETLHKTLSEPVSIKTHTGLPKFSYDYDIQLNSALGQMGMPSAFDGELADFSRMSSLDSYIGNVLHKTHIEVTEEGTRAAAVTMVEMECGDTLEPEETRTVELNRPFVYMIVDLDTSLPIFMGTVKSLETLS